MILTNVVFCAAVLLLLGKTQSLEVGLKKRSALVKRGEVVHHDYTEDEGDCSASHFKAMIKEVTLNSSCKIPLDTIVELNSKDPTYEFKPAHVRVPRCSGSCSTSLSCMAIGKEFVSLTVYRVNRHTNERSCGVVEVEKHIECLCDCEVEEKHCNSKQEYSSDNCACNCKDNGQDKCREEGNEWNKNQCQCECPSTGKVCPGNLVWVPSLCSCRQLKR